MIVLQAACVLSELGRILYLAGPASRALSSTRALMRPRLHPRLRARLRRRAVQCGCAVPSLLRAVFLHVDRVHAMVPVYAAAFHVHTGARRCLVALVAALRLAWISFSSIVTAIRTRRRPVVRSPHGAVAGRPAHRRACLRRRPLFFGGSAASFVLFSYSYLRSLLQAHISFLLRRRGAALFCSFRPPAGLYLFLHVAAMQRYVIFLCPPMSRVRTVFFRRRRLLFARSRDRRSLPSRARARR